MPFFSFCDCFPFSFCSIVLYLGEILAICKSIIFRFRLDFVGSGPGGFLCNDIYVFGKKTWQIGILSLSFDKLTLLGFLVTFSFV